jgi:hypothetical protein
MRNDFDRIKHNTVTEFACATETEQLNKMETQGDANGSEPGSLPSGPPTITTVPWLRQLSCVLRKNALLLTRRPVQVVLMILSSVGSVLLAFWAITGSELDTDFGTVPLTSCGTVELSYLDEMPYDKKSQVPLSYNESFRGGLPVIVMGEYCVSDSSCESSVKMLFPGILLM